jgi:predicted anti-sigma-YlaC factor YlaD
MYIKCSVVATKISEIIDHEASFMARMRFYSHLMMCSKCRDYFKQFKLLKETAAQHDPEALPDDFDNVMNFVMDEIEANEKKVT